ncbi:response regulator [Pedobacter yulinensis]|uniref:Response regulator n=1 Tax=Pedobacter yulinensis TaxID=2126353 RepID=A0A2T3HIZ0_9SPHI|nr:response regulator [Pedobacter yulinensis]PST82397.1 response regulator [Pedobacter yulinensis]
MEQKRILVIDDDEDVLETIELVLEIGNYEVSTLLSAEQIFERIEEFGPELIILDVVLGKMDGRVICEQLKMDEDTKDIPILMMSGLRDYQYVMNEEHAPNDFLPKPFDINVLLKKIKTLLKQVNEEPEEKFRLN